MLGITQDASQHDIGVSEGTFNPGDTVSCISWAPPNPVYSDIFLATSWDSKAWIYSIKQSGNKTCLSNMASVHTDDPCLSGCFMSDHTKFLVGTIEGFYKFYDLEREEWLFLGKREDAVKDVYWSEENRLAIILSYDRKLTLFDLRQGGHVRDFELNGQVYCSDMRFPHLMMGLSTAELAFTNLEMLFEGSSRNIFYRDSPSGSDQITAVAFHNWNMEEVGVTCVTGRTSVCLIDPYDLFYNVSKKLTFKGHKSGEARRLTLYPGNAVGFLPHPGAMFTGGSEGNIIFWNSDAKSTVRKLPFDGRSVCKAKVSPRGDLLAYALGYDWTRGIEGDQSLKSEIFVHTIEQKDIIKENANNS